MTAPDLTKLLADLRGVLQGATSDYVVLGQARTQRLALLADRAEVANLLVRCDAALRDPPRLLADATLPELAARLRELSGEPALPSREDPVEEELGKLAAWAGKCRDMCERLAAAETPPDSYTFGAKGDAYGDVVAQCSSRIAALRGGR